MYTLFNFSKFNQRLKIIYYIIQLNENEFFK